MESFYDFCMKNGKQALLSQWSDRNAPLTAQSVGHASRKKVWWQCEHGHRWRAAVYARTVAKGTECPVCARQMRQSEIK